MNMSEHQEIIQQLCHLARLSLQREEWEKFRQDFTRILEFIDKVKSLGLPSQKVLPLVSKDSMHLAEDEPSTYPLPQNFKKDYYIGSINDLD